MQYPYIPQTPVLATKTDSVISHMQYKIDSLSKIVEKTEIAHGFFSDVISQDLYMFSTIVVIAGLVSWGFVAGVLALHKRKVSLQVQKTIDENNLEINKTIKNLSYKTNKAVYDVSRAMFGISSNKDSDPSISLKWSLTVCEILRSPSEGAKPLLKNWVSIAKNKVDLIEIGNKHLIKNIDHYVKILNKVIAHTVNQIEVQKEAQYILNQALHKAYTLKNEDGNEPLDNPT